MTVGLASTVPENLDGTFTEQYGSQELNAVPLDPGQSKDVKFKVRPPNTVAAGKFKVGAKATAEDAIVTTELRSTSPARPRSISRRPRRPPERQGDVPGPETTIPIVVTNTGTAAAEQVELSGSGPSGWKVGVRPEDRSIAFRRTRTRKCSADHAHHQGRRR